MLKMFKKNWMISRVECCTTEGRHIYRNTKKEEIWLKKTTFSSTSTSAWSLLRKHASNRQKEPEEVRKELRKSPGPMVAFQPTVMQPAFWGVRATKTERKKEETVEKGWREGEWKAAPLCQERSITTLNHRGRVLPRKCLPTPSPGTVHHNSHTPSVVMAAWHLSPFKWGPVLT